jgi:LysM repeat protein
LMPRIPAPFLAAADAPEPASEGDITSGSESTSPDEGTNLVEPAEQTGPVPDQEPSSEAASTQSETDENTQEMSYTIERGDTLASIVRRAVEAGLQITVQDLLSANPELQPTRLRIGQEIAIPLTR